MNKPPSDPVNYELQDGDLGDGFEEFLDTVTNVPQAPPLQGIYINEAGIANQSAYVQIRDIEGKDVYKPILCNLQISSSLEGHRGVHMSRFEEALFEATKEKHDSIDAFAIALTRAVRDGQESKGAVIRVEGIYIHERTTRRTNRTSHDKLYLLSEAEVDGDIERVRTGVRAYNINACPCTRAHTKYSAVPALQEAGFQTNEIRRILDIMLTGTHTQRGTISVVIDKTAPDISSGNIYGVIDQSAHLVYELLKRPDEHELVSRALARPQFTEDVVRETAFNLYQEFREMAPGTTCVDIESLLHDSIHIHDVRTKISTTLEKIAADIESANQNEND